MSLEVEVVEEEIPSPFIPGTNIQFAWDATAIEIVKLCGRKRYFSLQGWRSREESIDLRWGHEFHRCMQDYQILMAEGFDHDDSMGDVIRSLLFRIEDFDPDHKQKNRENLVKAVVWYLETHKDDSAKTWIMSDGKPAVEIRFALDLEFGPTADQPYVLCGKLDRIVVFNDDLFIMDYKTTSSLGQYWRNSFTPNNQMTCYTYAGKRIFRAPIKGVIIDGIQPLVGGINFERHIVYRTEEQIQEWLVDLDYHLTQANWWAQRDYWPHNDTSCTKYKGCEYRGICEKSPQVRDRFLKANFAQENPWNPLMPASD